MFLSKQLDIFLMHAREIRVCIASALYPRRRRFVWRNAQSPRERNRTAYLTARARCVITYLRIKRARAFAAAKSAYNIDVIRH